VKPVAPSPPVTAASLDDAALSTPAAAAPVAGVLATSGSELPRALLPPSLPAAVGAQARPGAVASAFATDHMSWSVSVTPRGELPLRFVSSRRSAPGLPTVDAARLDLVAPGALEHLGSRPGVPSAWSDPAVASVLRSVTASTSRSGARTARSASTGGRHGLPMPTPFGPPGRGAVAGAASGSSAAAGSTVAAALLLGGLLLFSQPLRRFRLMPVMPGPVGFASLQQRPG
jgi:hypothetical protein